MLAQRTLLRSAQRLRSRIAPLRAARRNYSAETESGFKAQDNAFNRERAAVKAHAAASSGTNCG
jgi:cytochrome c oxidase subunit 6a